MYARLCRFAIFSAFIALIPTTASAYGTSPSACAWHVVASPNVRNSNSLVAVSALSANDAWAVGNTGLYHNFPLAEHWNGASWSVVQTPVDRSGLYGVAAISSNDVWTVGAKTTNSGIQPIAEHWNGSSWSLVSSPKIEGAFFSVSATSINDVWAAGEGPAGSTLVEHWNGASWKILPTPNMPGGANSLWAIGVIGTGEIWTDGLIAGDGHNLALRLHWNGSKWIASSALAVNLPVSSELHAVAAIAYNDVWEFGYGEDSRHAPRTLAEHWNGISWSTIASPILGAGTEIRAAVSASTSDVWAVGLSEGSNVAPYTMHWNGGAWSTVATPDSGNSDFLGVALIPGTQDIWAVGSASGLNGLSSATLAERFHC